MKNKLKLLIFILFLSVYGCGYEPIFSNKNITNSSGVSINNITFLGYSKLNSLIERKLKFYQNKKIETKGVDVILDLKKDKKILSKNKIGDPETFEVQIIANVIINRSSSSQTLYSSDINYSRKYSNLENKFDLSQEENIITNNLVDEDIDEIIQAIISST